jgi:hypothetical protein
MSGTRFNELRARYRSLWDAHQIIADANVRLLLAGTRPSAEQVASEKHAAEAVLLARDELLAAIARLGH